MVTLKEQVPKPLRGPMGLVSLVVGVLGISVGYIITLLGLSLYFDLTLPNQISAGESLVVLAVGLVALAVGYFGWRGFMYFAY